MRWIQKDMSQYIGAKEYIDSLLIPLSPFQLTDSNNMAKHAFQTEVLTIFTNELEKELTGRILLTPNYTYIASNDQGKDTDIERINNWIQHAKSQPFNHCFIITFDAAWKKHEQALDGHLIWLPGMTTGDIHSPEMAMVIRDQVNQVSELIRSYW